MDMFTYLDPAFFFHHDGLGGLYDGENEGEHEEERHLRLNHGYHAVFVVRRVRHTLGVHFQRRCRPSTPLAQNGLAHQRLKVGHSTGVVVCVGEPEKTFISSRII